MHEVLYTAVSSGCIRVITLGLTDPSFSIGVSSSSAWIFVYKANRRWRRTVAAVPYMGVLIEGTELVLILSSEVTYAISEGHHRFYRLPVYPSIDFTCTLA